MLPPECLVPSEMPSATHSQRVQRLGSNQASWVTQLDSRVEADPLGCPGPQHYSLNSPLPAGGPGLPARSPCALTGSRGGEWLPGRLPGEKARVGAAARGARVALGEEPWVWQAILRRWYSGRAKPARPWGRHGGLVRGAPRFTFSAKLSSRPHLQMRKQVQEAPTCLRVSRAKAGGQALWQWALEPFPSPRLDQHVL